MLAAKRVYDVFDTHTHTHTHTRMQVEKLQELLAAKSVYDDAIGAIKKRAGMRSSSTVVVMQ